MILSEKSASELSWAVFHTISKSLVIIFFANDATATTGLSGNENTETLTWTLILIGEAITCAVLFKLYKSKKKKWILYASPLILIMMFILLTLISWFLF